MIKIKIFQKKALIPLIVLCVIILMIISGCTVSQIGEAGSGDYTPTCGDNKVNRAAEQCDGSDLDGETCQSLGYPQGTLSCTSGCKFDFIECGRTSTRIASNTFSVSIDVTPDPELTSYAVVECFPDGDIPMGSTISNGGMWLGVGEECTDLCGDSSKDCIVWIAMDDSELAEETGFSTNDDSVSYEINAPNDELIGYSGGQVTVDTECGDGPCNGNENCFNCPTDCGNPIDLGSDDYICP